jgi:Rrf2 family protein
MLALTRKTDYAIVALAYMAQQGHGVFTAREISERFHMPLPLLMNILKSLCHGELVRSTRGVKGGYSLAMPAEQITLDSIIRVVEGPVHFVQCATEGVAGESCDLVHTCPVTRPIRKIHAKLKDFLNSVTLAQIANDEDYGVQCIPLSHHGAAVKMER